VNVSLIVFSENNGKYKSLKLISEIELFLLKM